MKTALVIGDSHVDWSPLGKALDAELKTLGYQVTRAGVGATAAKTWINKEPVCRPDGTHCVTKANLPKGADLLVIVLGTNDAANAHAAGGNLNTQAENNVKLIQKLADSFSSKSVLWVGPPTMRDNHKHYTNDVMATLYDAAKRLNVPVLDSRPATKLLVETGDGDGVHVGKKGGKAWAKAIAEAITTPPGKIQKGSMEPWVMLAGILLIWTAVKRWTR